MTALSDPTFKKPKPSQNLQSWSKPTESWQAEREPCRAGRTLRRSADRSARLDVGPGVLRIAELVALLASLSSRAEHRFLQGPLNARDLWVLTSLAAFASQSRSTEEQGPKGPTGPSPGLALREPRALPAFEPRAEGSLRWNAQRVASRRLMGRLKGPASTATAGESELWAEREVGTGCMEKKQQLSDSRPSAVRPLNGPHRALHPAACKSNVSPIEMHGAVDLSA